MEASIVSSALFTNFAALIVSSSTSPNCSDQVRENYHVTPWRELWFNVIQTLQYLSSLFVTIKLFPLSEIILLDIPLLHVIWNISDLRDLVTFAQYKKGKNTLWRSDTFSIVAGWSPQKVSMLYGCFSRF